MSPEYHERINALIGLKDGQEEAVGERRHSAGEEERMAGEEEAAEEGKGEAEAERNEKGTPKGGRGWRPRYYSLCPFLARTIIRECLRELRVGVCRPPRFCTTRL